MKKQIMVEQTFCDVCGKEAGYNTCMKCGKEFCYDCKKNEAIEYPPCVYFNGSGEGLYCIGCDAELVGSGDKLHAAYKAVKALLDESAGWGKDFKKRSDAAEQRLKALSR